MAFLLFILLLFSNGSQAFNDCEATIEEGIHKGYDKQVAIDAAWEEAVDNCYPGKAQRLSSHCKAVDETDSENPSTQFSCTQEVSCTTCGGDLKRKYEALD